MDNPTRTVRDETDIRIRGIRVETSDKHTEYDDNGIPQVLINLEFEIRIFGTGISEDVEIAFTNTRARKGEKCENLETPKYSVSI